MFILGKIKVKIMKQTTKTIPGFWECSRNQPEKSWECRCNRGWNVGGTDRNSET